MRRPAAALALVLLLASSRAAADNPPTTHVQTEEPRLLCVPPMSATARCRELPPGRFVDEGTWGRLDAELRRSNDSETRLKAENESLRKSVRGWSPGWKTLATTLIVGLAGGAYLKHKL